MMIGSDRWGVECFRWWFKLHLGRLDIRTGFWDGRPVERHVNHQGFSFIVQILAP